MTDQQLQTLLKSNKFYELISEQTRNQSNVVLTNINKFYILVNNMFTYENLPEDIPEWFLEQELHENGSVLFFKHGEKYYVSKYGNGGKLNAYYEPINYIVSNPYITTNSRLEFGENEAVIIKADHKKQGLDGIIKDYAVFKTEASTTVNTNLIYSRAHKILSAQDSDDVEALNDALKNLKEGKLTSIARASFLSDFQEHELGTPEIDHEKHIKIEQYRKAEFLNTLGISLNEDMGSQYTNKAETDMNNSQTHSYIMNMLTSRRESIKKINELFGLNIEVHYNPEWFNKPVDVKEELEPETPEENGEEPKQEGALEKLKKTLKGGE